MATTKRTRKTTRSQVTPGFAVGITKTTDLGIAMLIVEDEDGHYEPVGPVATVNEAYEIAANDLANRKEAVAKAYEIVAYNLPGRKDAVAQALDPLCPYAYRVWAAGIDGTYRTAWLILASEL